MTRIVRAIQTCWACPAQWDAWDETGRYWYFRFRSGQGSAECETGERRYFSEGDGLDGYIELEDFCELAGLELNLSRGRENPDRS